MAQEPVRISRNEYSSDEVLDYLDEGRRVVVTIGKFGVEKEVTLRKSNDQYVCDTGLKLLTYEGPWMKQCMERLRLTSPE